METPQLSTVRKEFKEFRSLRSSKRGARSQNPGGRRRARVSAKGEYLEGTSQML
jgi:hypothetical protein